MRRAIEKLTFSLLSLAVASLLTFVILARMAGAHDARSTTLPLLFNTTPRNVRDLSLAAADRVARGGPLGAEGRRELERLGGAAFPHVIPHLDALEPGARGRVALALGPVARRMGVADADDIDTPERAIGFFTRFWQDRSADFRAAAVKRKVSRLAERALPLRVKEVTELDTFALPELLGALGTLRGPDDVRRIARLLPVVAHVTKLDLALSPEAPLERARAIVTEVRRFATEHGADFATLDGPARVSATITQTRYSRWLSATMRALGPNDPDGKALALGVLAATGRTVPLALLALLGAAALVVAGRRVLRRARRVRVAGALVLLAGIPASVAAIEANGIGRVLATAALMVVLAAVLAFDLWAHGGTRWRPSRVVARVGLLIPSALSAELAVEAVLGQGLGAIARRALATGDIVTLMWAALPISASGLAGVIVGDLDPPRAGRVSSAYEAKERRASVLFALAGWFALLLLAALIGPFVIGPASRALRGTILSAFVIIGVAGSLGISFGILAGGLSRTASAVLARGREIAGAMPQPFVTCAALTFGGLVGAALIAVVRAAEVAHSLSRRLNERRLEEGLSAPSVGGTPLAPYLRRLLPDSIRATAVTLALSVPWAFGLEAAARALHRAPAASLLALGAAPAGEGTLGVAVLLFLGALGASVLGLAVELSPREAFGETPSSNVVLALKRRAGSASSPRITEADARSLDETDGAR